MREIIGSDIMLMIDSNHAYNYNKALLAKKIENLISLGLKNLFLPNIMNSMQN